MAQEGAAKAGEGGKGWIRAIAASPWPWLLGLLLFGVAARARQYFGCPSYWYDEAYLLLNIFDHSLTELLGPLDHCQVCPPLFSWALRGLYLLAGRAEWAMRLPAAVAGLAALLAMVPLARRVAPGPGWLWAVGLCAVSHHAILHAYEVKPYASDLLLTECILLAGWAWLDPDSTPRGRRMGLAGLLASAVVAPWLSFPSALVLAGVSLAVLAAAVRRRQRPLWLGWLAFNGLLALSGAVLWYVAARHLYYPGLREHWEVGAGFPESLALPTVLPWLLGRAVAVGDYGTTGMGLLLLVLGIVGMGVLWRRSKALALLVAGPAAVAAAAGLLRRYPLCDRTVLFLVPCCWLLAAAGLGAILRRLPERFSNAMPLLVLLLLAPEAARSSRLLLAPRPKVEFREAFAYIQQHRTAGDALWVSYPQVYEVYFGADPDLLGAYSPADAVARAARTRRLWVVRPPAGGSAITPFLALDDGLQAAHCRPAERHETRGLEIMLFEPPDGP